MYCKSLDFFVGILKVILFKISGFFVLFFMKIATVQYIFLGGGGGSKIMQIYHIVTFYALNY